MNATDPLWQQIRGFRRPFWAANAMELIERLAYYGVRAVIPLYIASSEDPAGLHFTNVEKAQILMPWALVQTLLPMFTGGYADRYGRKQTIAVSIGIKIAGYLVMASQRSFWGFLVGCLLLAAGTAVFKPGVQGTLIRGTTPRNSSIGWGIFYQMVNIGGTLGPVLAGLLRRLSWSYVFYACAGIVALNFITLQLYEDDRGSGKGDALDVFTRSVRTLFRPRLITFIVISSGFWVMFMQLFDTLPNFIEEWIDSRDLIADFHLKPGLFERLTQRGPQVPPEEMINLDALLIVFGMVPIASMTARIRRLASIVIGIVIASLGLYVAGTSSTGLLCLAGIAIFAVGEMVASPKMNEYLGIIAPAGDEALYMGFANIPLAIGWTSGLLEAGVLYDRIADKANLAVRYLTDHRLMSPEALGALNRTDAVHALEQTLGVDTRAVTQLLWQTYAPYTFWYGFVAVGIASAVGMTLYAWVARTWTVDNA